MEHFIDIYNKKSKGPKYCEDLLNDKVKVNLKVDGKPFQVLYNERTDELEWHGRSGNETTVGPIIDDYTRLFSKPINDAIAHIEPRKELFKNYKFITFEVLDNTLLLTAIIDKNDNFINDASEIKKIAKRLDTDVMPTLWEGKLTEEQKSSILVLLQTGIVPTKEEFIKWITEMFGAYFGFPKKLISASDEYVEGIVLFFGSGNDIIEYKIVDPAYRNFMRNRKEEARSDDKQHYYEEAYELMVNWLISNAKKLDNNQVKSMQLNFIRMSESSIWDRLISLANNFRKNISTTYTIQTTRVIPEIASLLNKNESCKELFELYLKTFYKEKKRAFIISKEFQQKINSIVNKMCNESRTCTEYIIEAIKISKHQN